jgi:hypothetical protein
MDINQEINMLMRWLGSESHFNAKPETLEFHKLLQEPDSEKLSAIVEEHGGVRALEIKLYGAPLSYLLGRGYAPGQYMGTCPGCQETFIGDKRAISCLPCAVKTYAAVSNR